MITSLLDTDFYKLSMHQIVLHQFTDTMVRYKFRCRSKDIKFSKPCCDRITNAIYRLDELNLTRDEAGYLKSIRFLKRDYIEFLSMFRFMPDRHVHISRHHDGGLELQIVGPWLNTILYEVPVLAIINEEYFRELSSNKTVDPILNLEPKIAAAEALDDHGFVFSDFGTRRRFSYDVQRLVLTYLASTNFANFSGTSNVHLAQELGLKPIGTMAHEYLQCHQAMHYKLADSQKMALENWAKEYRGDLGIALTDTINMDAFLRDFDGYYAKLFDGCRHDSGDPYVWCEKLIAHYEQLGIDPKAKTAVFSDGLTVPKAIDLYERFHRRIKMAFGIGTNLTNDVGYTPLQIVMKVVECNGQPVAKLSEDPGKQMCENESFVTYLKQVFKVTEGK